MITLGIDPGTAIMGYGLVESGAFDSGVSSGYSSSASTGEDLRLVEYGALRTPANAPLSADPVPASCPVTRLYVTVPWMAD